MIKMIKNIRAFHFITIIYHFNFFFQLYIFGVNFTNLELYTNLILVSDFLILLIISSRNFQLLRKQPLSIFCQNLNGNWKHPRSHKHLIKAKIVIKHILVRNCIFTISLMTLYVSTVYFQNISDKVKFSLKKYLITILFINKVHMCFVFNFSQIFLREYWKGDCWCNNRKFMEVWCVKSQVMDQYEICYII